MKSNKYRYGCIMCDDCTDWESTIEVVYGSDKLVEFIVRARGSWIRGVVWKLEGEFYVSFPELKKCSGLTHFEDLYWNTEALSQVLGNNVDGRSVAYGLQELHLNDHLLLT